MDPLTLALIIGGGSAFAAKMGGAKTGDALKSGILSGGLSMLNPAAAASNPFATAFAEQSGKEGIKALLIESAKQGLMQRGAKKLGIDPNIAMLGYGMFNTPGKIPGMTNASEQVNSSLTNNLNVNEAFPGQGTSEIINNSTQYGSMPNFYDPSQLEGGGIPVNVGGSGINQIPNNVVSQIPVIEQKGMPFPHTGMPTSTGANTMLPGQTGTGGQFAGATNVGAPIDVANPGNFLSNYKGEINTDTDYLKTITDVFKKDGKYDIDKIAKGATLFGVPAALYLSGAFKQQPKTMNQPTYNINYPQLRQARGPLQRLDQQGNQVDVAMTAYPEQLYGSSGNDPYAWSQKTFYPEKKREGGLVSIQKFNAGGLSKVPNKVTHDENDVNNYMRINGYMEDSNGDKNEDTLLAQLADGEFVTRTDGVLGAGIIAGANPKNEKEMREKGAKFFYEQQKRFKRIFDLLDENRARKLH
jgi:hypothetical protein